MSEAPPLDPLPGGISTRRLAGLALSAFVVLAAEPSYLLVDTAVVGHLGTRPLAALGLAAAVVGLLLVVGDFVEYGTTGRVARAHGAGRTDDVRAEAATAAALGLGVGIALAVAGELLAAPLVRLLAGGEDAVRTDAVDWLRIGLLGLPGVLTVLAGNGWMRGVQLTREPVRIVVLANVVSAALCPVLVYPAGLGLRGSAVANLLGQATGGALFLRARRRALGGGRPRRALVRAQLRVGRDLVVRSVGFQAAGLAAAGVAARMGSAQLAAHQIGLQLDTFSALLLDSVAIAAQSVVGAALGAGDVVTARRVAWRVTRWGGVAGVGFAGFFGIGWWLIPRVFSSDPSVLHQTHVLWPWFVAALVPAGALFALDGVLIGAGDVGFMAALTLVAGLGAFVPIDLAALHFGWGLGGVWAGLLAFYLVRLAGMVARTRGARWAVTGPSGSGSTVRPTDSRENP